MNLVPDTSEQAENPSKMGALTSDQDRILDKLLKLITMYLALMKTNFIEQDRLYLFSKINSTLGRFARLMAQDPNRPSAGTIVALVKGVMSECPGLLDLEMMQYFDVVFSNTQRNLSYGNSEWSKMNYAPVGTKVGSIYVITATWVFTCMIERSEAAESQEV